METVGRNNPGAKDWWCSRQDCAPCQGRRALALEEVEEALMRSEGKEVKKKSNQDRTGLPSCTSEGVNYVLECLTCRRRGLTRQYYGETSRSGYQRGVEHTREIEEGIASHPLVVHYWEEHAGRKQDFICRRRGLIRQWRNLKERVSKRCGAY